MGKNTNFSGQLIFNQLIKFIDKSEIRKIAKHHRAERYVKKFSTYNHVIVMHFVALKGFHSIREAILGLMANSHKLSHLGLSYLVRRSTFSEANQRRSCKVFGDIYMSVYRNHVSDLADSRLSDADLKRLYYTGSKSIFLKTAFMKPMQAQRCLVIADAYYEWSDKKKPHLVFLQHRNRPFAFARIYDRWQNPVSNDIVTSFAIITTVANSFCSNRSVQNVCP
jgi:hypothetical protein